MNSVLASSVKLAPMTEAEEQDSGEWISPIGRSISEVIAEEEARDPEYRKDRDKNRPRHELAQMILIRRTELDITRQELADRMRTSLSVISRRERGQQNFSTATLQRLAQALETRLVYSFEVNDPRRDGESTRSLVVVP
jgi:ribosome-binding protein aMBF1 (putative translation factor)